ncbi:hypothetical protein JCM19037_4680 [Geomicrobium sp. JCM 19037]|nr:hypothetical protein JCM19037_4680 [Geomicrobium sp. JCM 19037]
MLSSLSVIVLPLFILEYFIRVGSRSYFELHALDGVGTFVSVAATILILAQLPFIMMGATSFVHEIIRFSVCIKAFFKYLFPVIGSSLVFMIAAVAGLYALIIPGLYILVMAVIHPYAAIIHNKMGRLCFRSLQLVSSLLC